MQHTSNKFELSYNLALIQVERLINQEQELYSVKFSNEVPEIIIACTYNQVEMQIWDSVPAGNKALAEAIGTLIAEYLKKEK